MGPAKLDKLPPLATPAQPPQPTQPDRAPTPYEVARFKAAGVPDPVWVDPIAELAPESVVDRTIAAAIPPNTITGHLIRFSCKDAKYAECKIHIPQAGPHDPKYRELLASIDSGLAIHVAKCFGKDVELTIDDAADEILSIRVIEKPEAK